MVEQKPLVTITGVAGFIGSHICLNFLKSGDYRVRGCVRDHTNAAKNAALKKAFGELYDQLELVSADLMDEEALSKAIEGSTYVVHTASPFFYGGTEEQVIKPAIQGTLGVLKACQKHKIKRCVVTSSGLSVICMKQEDKPDPDTGSYDEKCWSDPEIAGLWDNYAKSKVLAEKAAWEFHSSLPEEEKFELTVVIPVFVQGPSLIPGGHTSGKFIERFFDGSMKQLDTRKIGYVDVRDVAWCHFLAIKTPEAAGQRIISCSGESFYTKEVAEILAAEFGPQGYKIPTQEVGTRLKDAVISNAKAKALFNMDFRTGKEAVLSMAYSLIELGVIKPPKKQSSSLFCCTSKPPK